MGEAESVLTAMTACSSGLEPASSPRVEFLPVADDLFDHGPYLVDLDGVDDEVLSFVAVFLRCQFEAVGYLFDTVVKNVREAYQYGSRHVPNGQFVHQFP